ncbi:MAG: CcdB family protein [Steroidobacteraceae bacterium]
MAQFDVFANPIATIRRAYPFVVTLQSDFAQNARQQIVAPLVPLDGIPKVISRLTPIVALDGAEHVVLIPALTGMPARDLKERAGSIAAARSELLAAIDYLFFGV